MSIGYAIHIVLIALAIPGIMYLSPDITGLRQEIEDLRTQIEIIELMPGPEGPEGPEGPRGPRGRRGEQGEHGLQGEAASDFLSPPAVALAEELAEHLVFVEHPTGRGEAKTLMFTRLNVQVVAGGITPDHDLNGLGNLIIGYGGTAPLILDTDDDGDPDSIGRFGTNNLVVGDNNSYVGNNSVVFGLSNLVGNRYSSCLGGSSNRAGGRHAVNIGGVGNIASGENCVVVGGLKNVVTGESNVIGGGHRRSIMDPLAATDFVAGEIYEDD